MENLTQNREPVIQITGLKKQYKLGQIGGGTLTAICRAGGPACGARRTPIW